jgi:hypothetical protein
MFSGKARDEARAPRAKASSSTWWDIGFKKSEK